MSFVSLRRRLILPAIALLLATGTAPAAETFKIDPVHTFVSFRIKHMNVSYTYGRFNAPEGQVVVDEDPAKSSLEIKVQASNIDTGNEGRDKHLKGPDFFNTEEFPEVTFKSTAIKSAGDSKWEVTGDLTLHGVTKSVTLTLDRVGAGKGMKGEALVGFEGALTIKRSEYGMTGYLEGIGDEVNLWIAIEANQG